MWAPPVKQKAEMDWFAYQDKDRFDLILVETAINEKLIYDLQFELEISRIADTKL